MPITMSQAEAIRLAIENPSVRAGLEQFCMDESDKNRRSMQGAMQSVPRRFEAAADFAASAGIYDGFVKRLLAALEKS